MHRLIEDGHEVLCLDNFLTGVPANVEHLIGNPAFRLIRADVTDYLHVTGEVDMVLHFASPASPIDYLELPIETMKVGSIGTLHALGWPRRRGARFVLASTSRPTGTRRCIRRPRTTGATSTRSARAGCTTRRSASARHSRWPTGRTHQVNTGIVRIFNTFGPRMRPNDGRAIPNFVRQALRDDPITVAGDGSQTRSVCYVDDLIEGIVRFAATDHPGPMNIGNPNEISMLDLAKWICTWRSRSRRSSSSIDPPDDPSVRQPDITLARTTLGWSPEVPIEDGLLRTIDVVQESPRADLIRPDARRGGPVRQELVELGVQTTWSTVMSVSTPSIVQPVVAVSSPQTM